VLPKSLGVATFPAMITGGGGGAGGLGGLCGGPVLPECGR